MILTLNKVTIGNNEVFMVIVRLNIRIIPRKLAANVGSKNEDEFSKKEKGKIQVGIFMRIKPLQAKDGHKSI